MRVSMLVSFSMRETGPNVVGREGQAHEEARKTGDRDGQQRQEPGQPPRERGAGRTTGRAAGRRPTEGRAPGAQGRRDGGSRSARLNGRPYGVIQPS
jgi:hypothetical protein